MLHYFIEIIYVNEPFSWKSEKFVVIFNKKIFNYYLLWVIKWVILKKNVFMLDN